MTSLQPIVMVSACPLTLKSRQPSNSVVSQQRMSGAWSTGNHACSAVEDDDNLRSEVNEPHCKQP